MLEILDLAGGPVAGQNDLFVPLVQRVEGMEKFLLDPFFACQKLNVVDQQNISLSIFSTKTGQLVILDSVDVLVGKLFRRNVSHARVLSMPGYMLANGVQQMRFAQAHAAIQEKRVIGFAGRLRQKVNGLTVVEAAGASSTSEVCSTASGCIREP